MLCAPRIFSLPRPNLRSQETMHSDRHAAKHRRDVSRRRQVYARGSDRGCGRTIMIFSLSLMLLMKHHALSSSIITILLLLIVTIMVGSVPVVAKQQAKGHLRSTLPVPRFSISKARKTRRPVLF